MPKKCRSKYYVVWRGIVPGIYQTWEECQRQVIGVQGATYKSYPTIEEAVQAFAASEPNPVSQRISATKTSPLLSSHNKNAAHYDLPPDPPADRHDTVLPLPAEVKARAIAVDAACSGNPGPMEYRGVCLTTGQELFHYGPVYGTNNIGEFLAIVHGLALIKQQGLTDMTIYSDSHNALLWVRSKKCKTKLARTSRTEALYQLIGRAEQWLHDNPYDTPLVKWETERWGEIPADFGRK